MSKLEELIQQHCPDGVEWILLGDACDIHTGKAALPNTRPYISPDGNASLIFLPSDSIFIRISLHHYLNVVAVCAVYLNKTSHSSAINQRHDLIPINI